MKKQRAKQNLTSDYHKILSEERGLLKNSELITTIQVPSNGMMISAVRAMIKNPLPHSRAAPPVVLSLEKVAMHLNEVVLPKMETQQTATRTMTKTAKMKINIVQAIRMINGNVMTTTVKAKIFTTMNRRSTVTTTAETGRTSTT